MKELRPISVLVKNERGVLARVAGLFARRGFNITSLAVGETADPALSRISVVVAGDDATLDQVCKQLNRLVSVQQVSDLSRAPRVERGLALVKVGATPQTRGNILEIADIFRARIDHVDHETMIVEVTGNREKVQALIDMLRPFGILEVARTGQIVLGRQSAMDIDSGRKKAAKSKEEKQTIYNLNQQN